MLVAVLKQSVMSGLRPVPHHLRRRDKSLAVVLEAGLFDLVGMPILLVQTCARPECLLWSYGHSAFSNSNFQILLPGVRPKVPGRQQAAAGSAQRDSVLVKTYLSSLLRRSSQHSSGAARTSPMQECGCEVEQIHGAHACSQQAEC